MVWGSVTYGGKSPLVFVDKGVKLNQSTYQNEILQKKLLPWSKQHFKKNNWVFQQDSAPAHKANTTQRWCEDNLHGFINANDWPPYSHDLNPLDFSVWSILESRGCSKPFENVKQLKASLVKAWNSIDDDTIRKIVDQFPDRLTKCIENEGGYIEN